MPEKKDYVSISKGVHKQNFSTCQSLCNLQESYNTFKEKRPNVNIWFSKFYVLRPKSCVVAGSKISHSVCVCSAHQNVVLLLDTLEWNLTYKDLIKKMVYNLARNKWIMHWCESCHGTATLKEFLGQELNEHQGVKKFNYCQWDTTDQSILTTFTATYEEYKETWIDVIDDLTRHSYMARLKITSS